ncbi:hypothetical protein DM02DRAFT_653435 [Periconia macrospinosa]|uniref:Uncharacterized protein n=1 Tax=Periconia macrospinosa TaxID=97972 RepID=A0A2V1DWY7_9PLEO|nr:hypothetical protein DM02DRAFT_653435 [Periconia macrospinosa]
MASREGSVSQGSISTDPLDFGNGQQTLNTNAYGLGISASPKEASVDSAEEDDISSTSDIPMSYYLNAGNWPQPQSTMKHSTGPSYTLPETVKISPFNVGLPFEGARSDPGPESPQTGWPQNIGWDFVRDSPKETDNSVDQNSDEIKLTLSNFDGFGRTTDTVPTISKKKAMEKKKGTSPHQLTFGKGLQGAYSYNQGSQSTSALNNIYREAKDIYMAGPKGEGYKLWNGIQQLRKQKKTNERTQLSITPKKTSPPPRPMPPAPLGVTRAVIAEDRLPDSPSSIAISRPPAGDIRRVVTPLPQSISGGTHSNPIPRGSVETHRSDPSSKFTIEVGASPQVYQDAQETVINYTKPRKPQAPRLLPAPKTKEEVKRRSSVAGKRGLPPPPVPTSPRRARGNYVVIGVEEQGSDGGKSRILLPLPHSQLQLGSSTDFVGSKVSLAPSSLSSVPTSIGETEFAAPVYQGNVRHHLTGLDGRVTERTRQAQNDTGTKTKQSWISRFFDSLCNVYDIDSNCQIPSQPTTRSVANRRLPTKQKNISKFEISYPRPMYIPKSDSTANISAVCGGVGGPAAAVSLSRDEEKEEMKKFETSTSSFQILPTKQPHKRVSSVPPRQRPTVTSLNSSSHDEQSTKKSKSSQSFWSDMVNPVMTTTASKFSVVGGGRRKRNDSDASFGCQGISMDDEDHHDSVVERPGAYDAVKSCPTDASAGPRNMASDTGASSHRGQVSQYKRGSISSIRESLLPPPLFSGRGASNRRQAR